MDAYFDSGVVVKLYVAELTSPEAIRIVASYATPYALTYWQELEVKNAIRLKCFRNEIAEAEMVQSLAAFEQDIATGRWERPVYSTFAVEQKAHELSAIHSVMIGCRTLDIIHIAAAIVLGASDFVSFDARQAALGTQAGLTVKP